MEVGVRIVGVILRILNFLFVPVLWVRSRNTKKVPPIRDPILLKSATDLAAAIRKGELTSEQVTNAFITRIQEVNIYLNAVVEDRFKAALEEARSWDRRVAEARKEKKTEELFSSRPLLGVPFTVKESCSLEGLSNAVGCLDFAGRRATQDGGAVALVKRAGAIPLLVSNTPELCLGWESTNLLNGTTNNPYCLNRTPGGSSGGEQDKSLFWEIIKSILGIGGRSFQALGFTLIHKSNLFIPERRTQYYHEKTEKFRERLERLLGSNGVLVYPVSCSAAPRHGSVWRASAVAYTMLLNVLGLPALALPLPHHAATLPLSVQVIAGPNQDRLCLAVVKELEKAFGGWKFPTVT